jgi:GNAT superfamily N-acetyltransferase
VFGDRPRHHILLAESGARTVGFIGWDAVYELQWAVSGGLVGDLFVVPSYRGLGIALALIARAAAEVHADGGAFLRGNAIERESTRRTYARFAVVAASGDTYLSNRAFRQVAELAELGPRDILRALPPVQWNAEP